MKFRGIVCLASIALFLVAVLVLDTVHTYAQISNLTGDSIFRVGLKSITLPAPSTELIETGSDYRVILDTLTPVTNRLVAAFLLPEDLKAIQTGPTPLSRYALVEVPRSAEFATISPEIFRQIATSIGQEFGGSLDATLKDQQDEINRRLNSLGARSTTVTLDKPMMLGSLFSKPDAVGFGGILPIDINGKKDTKVMGMSVVRTQERVLALYLYTSYVDKESVNWARTTSEKWAAAILAANK